MININPHIFRAYDIRGIAEKTDKSNPNEEIDLTPQTMELIGKGIGTYLKQTYKTKNMLVGHDNRLHSKKLSDALIKGVISTGIDVDYIGLSTSPLIYYGVCKFNFDSGINITASHNPKEYNGIKIVGKNATTVFGEEIQNILTTIKQNKFESGKGELKNSSIKTSEKDPKDAKSNYIFQTYLKEIKEKIKIQKQLKVVVDAGNGTAGIFAPTLLKKIGCEVVELFCESDGNFPNHEANPENEKNTRDLAKKVIETNADIGISFDGDGDRVGVVDEKGEHYSADYLIILLARDLLKTSPKSQIIFDVKVSQILIDEIKKLNGEPIMNKTGHSFIKSTMKKLSAPLAGEVSGHIFFGKKHYNYYEFDDALLASAKIIEILSKNNKSFSEHFKDLPKMETTPEFKAFCPDNKKEEIVKKLKQSFKKKYDYTDIDGIRVSFDKKSWGLVRYSNTSPNLTLRFEAENKQKLKEIQEKMVKEIKKHKAVSLDWYKNQYKLSKSDYPEVNEISNSELP